MAHLVLVPFMAQGHMIPMIDLGMLLAQHGALITFMTTPVNASRIRTTINTARESSLPIRFLELHFPCGELGLPEGCENADVVSTQKHMFTFFEATRQLKQPLELYLREHKPPPSCIVSDFCQPWTRDLAQSFSIPRLTFFSMSNFAILCYYNIWHYKVYSNISDDAEVFTVPGLGEKIEVTKAQAPGFFGGEGWEKVREEVREAEFEADGILVNSFHALEPSYFELYQKAMGKKVWTIGPLFLHKKDMVCLATRGNKSSLDVDYCMQWLDSMKPRSVLYISFGSLTQVKPSQLMEIGKGLEASNYPFIWVIKHTDQSSQEIEEWLSGGYEERVSSRGIIVRGWAPQLMILSHSAVGGFLTHCGWNSTLEAICAGVPMITWPHFSEQFLNERFVVDVLRIGVSVGVKIPNVMMQTAKKMLIVNGEDLEKAVKKVMDGEEGMEKRRRVEEIRKKAREAMEVGGSSYENVMHLIRWFSNDDKKKCMKEEE